MPISECMVTELGSSVLGARDPGDQGTPGERAVPVMWSAARGVPG